MGFYTNAPTDNYGNDLDVRVIDSLVESCGG